MQETVEEIIDESNNRLDIARNVYESMELEEQIQKNLEVDVYLLSNLARLAGFLCANMLFLFILAKVSTYYNRRKDIRSSTNLHRYPRLASCIQIIIVIGVHLAMFSQIFGLSPQLPDNLESLQTPKLLPNPSESAASYSRVTKFIIMMFHSVRFCSVVTVMFTLFGFFIPPSLRCKSARGRNENEHAPLKTKNNTLVVFRWVTRGTSPDLIKTNIARNWKIIKKYENVKLEVVTDNKIDINPELYGIPRAYFDEIVVPSDFQTPNKTLFKARALYFAALNSKLATDDCYIFHCDEESLVTDELLIGVKQFTVEHYGKIGQGLITYANEESSISSYLCHLADSIRVGDDRGRFRFQFRLIGKPICGLKGSFVLVPNQVEREQATSFDCCGAKGSITEDSWWAFTIFEQNKYSFAWCDGTLIEQSPFYIRDLVKQRKRWLSGLLLVLFYHPCKWYKKSLLALQLFAWTLLPLSTVSTFFVDIILDDAVMQHYDMPWWMKYMSFANTYMAAIFVMTYMLGNMLLVHKNYFEKIVLTFVSGIVLLPIIGIMESCGVLSALMYPDRNFGLIEKEGANIKKQQLKSSQLMV